ncbi:MAG: LysE family translocator [Verrucomicrobia bacterium]|nr:LysE family translocator [Verrucomicrobiota bacterium]
MTASFFIKVLIIGFSIAAPVGPIGVLCIRRSIAQGPLIGLLTGLGAATADAAYGGVAAFGLTAISDALVAQAFWLRLVGGAFLLYLGIKTFFAAPPAEGGAKPASSSLAAYPSTVVLTLTNPMTILSFVFVFAGLGLQTNSENYAGATVLVAGVFLGSALWWVLLSRGAGLLRSKVTGRWMCRVNQISGAVISGFGILALWSLRR